MKNLIALGWQPFCAGVDQAGGTVPVISQGSFQGINFRFELRNHGAEPYIVFHQFA
jgi:hypothetical protein